MTGPPESSERVVGFLSGFLPEIDVLPSDLAAAGLPWRCAAILHTFRSDSVDMFFDAELYWAVLADLAELMGADEVRLQVDWNGAIERIPIADVASWRSRAALDEPAHRVMLHRNGALIAAAESEPWAQVGGPPVYHDAYVVAVFTATPIADALQARIRSSCERLGARMGDVVKVEERPVRPSLVSRFKRWLMG